MRRLGIAVAVGSALLLFGQRVSAQEMETPPHIVTVTYFEVPLNELDDFWKVIDTYVFPSSKANPHVLSARIGGHYWGDSKKNVWFITEYENLGAIRESEAWDDKYFDEHYPEGSAARDSADAAFEKHFLSHFTGHQDNILTVNAKRMK